MRIFALAALVLLSCAEPSRPPASGPLSEAGGDWARCSASADCALVLTRAGGCCDYGEHRAVNARHQQAASRAWGPSPEELRQAQHESMTCTAGCAAPPVLVAACRAGSCVVTTAGEAPDGVSEAPPDGHLDRAPDGACIWWPSHCDDAPCTVSTTRVRCPVPFVRR